MTKNIITEIGSHPVPVTEQSFAELGLSAASLQLLKQVGFQYPTPIQREIIPAALQGKDVIGLSQTGSGKTAAFVLPLAERLQHGKGLRGLILSPTREIALQTKAFLDLFGRHHHLVTVCVIGGVRIGGQIHALQKKSDIVVATPGRLRDHLDRGTVKLHEITELVFDEADHMLDLGFLPQIQEIVKKIPSKRHTMMFSATMPAPIERLAKNYLLHPLRVDILPKGRAAQGIQHRLYLIDQSEKKKCLVALLHQELGSTLVFTATRRDANWLHRLLEKEGHPVTFIHSDRSQNERTRALDGFRKGKHRILIATDIASRGIDVRGIEHVINFSMPRTVEEYIHRTGRTARAEAVGLASTIATALDLQMVRKIEAALREKLPRCVVAGVNPYTEVTPKPFGRRRSGLKRKW